MTRTALPLALSAALAALLASGCARTAAAPASPDPAVAVRTVPVDRSPVQRSVRVAGTVAARDAWTLAFPAGGVVAAVNVREGQAVRRGDLLASLDLTPLEAQARQAHEALQKATRDAGRVRSLVAGEAAPAAAAQDAETGLEVAAAAVRAADFALARARLVARDDGWVDRRFVEPGEVVGPGQPIVSVSGRAGGWIVKAGLADRDVLGLAVGDPATAVLDARPGAPLAGHVAEIARSPSPATGTYEIQLRLDHPPADLVAGLTAKVELRRAFPAAGSVPLAAVLDGDGDRGAVFALAGGRARRVPVRIAFLQGERAVLAGGLEGVDEIVLEGASKLVDGAPVRRAP
ncbi:MAG: efflux RND transporter periplasmic adaptor subunit [Anaeromyxobacteraceae bacterium]